MEKAEEVDATECSLDDLFELHAHAVFGHVAKRCGDRSLAEDITAITFEAASRRFLVGQGHQVTLPWLFTVATRRLIDHWRRESTNRDRIRRLKQELLIVRTDHQTANSGVASALQALAPNQRAALVLRYLEDHAVSEVAEELGLTYKATESLLSRARRAFSLAYWEESK